MPISIQAVEVTVIYMVPMDARSVRQWGRTIWDRRIWMAIALQSTLQGHNRSLWDLPASKGRFCNSAQP